MPKVSVVIPTYNRPDTLERAIKSVVGQTRADIEILVVNDSPDEAPVLDVIGRFKDSRIRYFRNERTKGGNGARNTGILKAKEEYIAFLDDDDEWMPEKLEAQANRLQNLDSSWGGCYCGYKILENSRWRKVFGLKEGAFQKEHLLSKVPMCAGSTLLLKKAVFAKTGLFDEELQRHQEVHFLTVFLRHYKLAFVNKVLVCVNGHNPASADRTEQAKLQLFNKIMPDILKLNCKEQRKYYAFQYRELSSLFSDEHNFKKARYYLKKSLSYKMLFPTRYLNIILNQIDFKMSWKLRDSYESVKASIKNNPSMFRFLRRII